MTDTPSTQTTTEDRQYIDALKESYKEARAQFELSGNFIWACLFDPTPERSARHRRLVNIALKEMGLSEP